MKKYTLGEQHIYNTIMIKIRANWQVLIDYKKGYNEYLNLYGAESTETMISLSYRTIQTLYEVLEVGFYINMEKQHHALTNYRYYGRCHE